MRMLCVCCRLSVGVGVGAGVVEGDGPSVGPGDVVAVGTTGHRGHGNTVVS